MNVDASSARSTKTYTRPVPPALWVQRRGYVLYVIREFTAIPIAAWMLWLLVEIARLGAGRAGYRPHISGWFVAFSVVCLAFALWHSYTFRSLSGVIMRIPIGDRLVRARVIVAGAFGLWLAASVLIGGALVWLGR